MVRKSDAEYVIGCCLRYLREEQLTGKVGDEFWLADLVSLCDEVLDLPDDVMLDIYTKGYVGNYHLGPRR